MPAVRRHAGPEPRAFRHRDAVVRGVVDVEAPGIVEVVLAAGALDRGLRGAVHPEEVVPLAEPAGLGLDDGHHGADVVPLALRVEKHVVRAVGRRGKRLPVPRVKVRRVLGQRGQLFPVHVVVEVRDAPAALVRDRDPAGLLEGHGPVAVSGPAVGAVDDHHGLDLGLEAVAHREEVADRRVHRRHRAVVVIHAQAEQFRPAVLVVRDRDPHVRDDAGALEVREDGRLARDRTLAVVVRVPVLVIGGGSKRLEVLGLGQAERVGKARIDALRPRGEGPQQSGSGQGGEDSGVLHGLLLFGSYGWAGGSPFQLRIPFHRNR